MQPNLIKVASVFIWLLSFSVSATAQLNTLAGYVNAQADSKVLNNIIGNFNERNTKRLIDMPNLSNLNGMELGLRYRLPYYGVEANWANKFAKLKDRTLKADSTEFQNIVTYKIQSFSIGNEFYYKWFGVGGTVDFNQLRMRRERSSDSKKQDILKANYFSSQVFVNFEFTFNDILAFSIRPYVQIPWGRINYLEVEKGLNPDLPNATSPDGYLERNFFYGVRVMFVNGGRNETSRR